MGEITNNNEYLLDSIVSLIDSSRNRVASTINSELTLLYWNIGKQINESILKNKRADYGKQVVIGLSSNLVEKYGNNFSKRNLQYFMHFHSVFKKIEIVNSLSSQLSWTHIRYLLPIEDELKREFYIQMCKHERWSVRTMQGRISSMLFERTALSKKPEQTIINDLEQLEKERKISPDLTFKYPEPNTEYLLK